jgi:arginyl-tRNA--protein-N-Asp/Glu arginylyltransferase
MTYLNWDKKNITDFEEKNINSLYNKGYVFTRAGKGIMNQTRSLRIDLDKFELSSENKRILRKTKDVSTDVFTLPYENYHWSIHKMGKDFYTTKFGDKTFSANKIKELMTDANKSNFNTVFTYSPSPLEGEGWGEVVGYTIALETDELVHYSYPFYDLTKTDNNMGMGMMLKAITYAKEKGKKYIYLGSASRPTDTYKLQFSGLEWFDKEKWNTDLDKLKNILKI